jgi:hypothetical protein
VGRVARDASHPVISRRSFLRRAASGAALLPLGSRLTQAFLSPEVLYNGITLGTPWPPRRRFPDEHPVLPPYLADPPRVIPIDVGRQLFIDDFLIEETSLTRSWHAATYHPANPILRPDTEWERRDDANERNKRTTNPAAMPFSDGVFFDPKDRLFKMWYMAGYGMFTCLATSTDGITWRRPSFDVVPGTNIVHEPTRDSSTVWLDHGERDPRRRYKMAFYYDRRLRTSVSADGVHWNDVGATPETGDRSTFFLNPFRNVWVFSLRANQFNSSINGRYRQYWESPTFDASPAWRDSDPVAWVKADSADFSRPGMPTVAELYNLDCVGYESVMLGLFSVWRGETSIREKINELTVGFSRDGFHWSRPDRTTFVGVSDEVGSWNWGNIQSAGGCCTIVGDRLYFYVSGRQGRPGTQEPGVCSTGLATLRRDGFASMDRGADRTNIRRQPDSPAGLLTTRPIRFSGTHLFVNADVDGGDLRVEVLDRGGRVLAPFTRENCRPLNANGTRLPVSWAKGTIGDLAGQEVRLRFSLSRGSLYAFWVSPSETGRSRGYAAAGGPGIEGPTD